MGDGSLIRAKTQPVRKPPAPSPARMGKAVEALTQSAAEPATPEAMNQCEAASSWRRAKPAPPATRQRAQAEANARTMPWWSASPSSKVRTTPCVVNNVRR